MYNCQTIKLISRVCNHFETLHSNREFINSMFPFGLNILRALCHMLLSAIDLQINIDREKNKQFQFTMKPGKIRWKHNNW